MAQQLHIEIPSACDERWQEMEGRKEGRYCGSCRKTVVDFTNKTDAELAAFFRNYTGGACGRFHNEQLNRVLTVPRKPMPGLRYFFMVTLPAFLWSLKSGAQQASAPIAAPVAASHPEDRKEAALPQSGTIVSGTVKADDGTLIPFATVIVKGTRSGVLADANGVFRIELRELPARLVFSSVGFNPGEREVNDANKSNVSITLIRANMETLGGAIVVVHHKKKRRREPAPALAPAPATLRAFPNPIASGELLKVDGERLPDGTYTLQLWSLSGALLRNTQYDWEEKSRNPMLVETSGLPAGTYVLRAVHSKTGKAFSQQVLLQ